MPPTNPLAWVQSAACQSAAAFSPDFRTTTSDCAHAVCSDAPHVDGFSFVPPPVAPKVRGVTFDTAGGGAFSRALASAFVTTADSLLVHRYRATCMPGPQTGAVPSRPAAFSPLEGRPDAAVELDFARDLGVVARARDRRLVE
eukprot:CAMPEP_0180323436 /NCGR_PEP_ID=MMETSP0988-20121125/37304_1 /TAXON_ID=697907 /ORGANISM="non described non described, Strain CCMP2293" /LENGTH=142 /DNA_ID=CAMNT_0022309627 /DNA_START=210 /DNA_END=636 /DNA_ORIENTATION=-